VGLERDPLTLLRISEELLECKSSGSEISGRGHPLRFPRGTLYPQKLALTSQTSDSRLVGIVRLRTTATEFSLVKAWIVFSLLRHGAEAGRYEDDFET
jgi:hypothetical protein